MFYHRCWRILRLSDIKESFFVRCTDVSVPPRPIQFHGRELDERTVAVDFKYLLFAWCSKATSKRRRQNKSRRSRFGCPRRLAFLGHKSETKWTFEMTPPGSRTKKTLSETFLSAAIIDENYIAFVFFFFPLWSRKKGRERERKRTGARPPETSTAVRSFNSCNEVVYSKVRACLPGPS